MSDPTLVAIIRRREATRAFFRYFVLVFLVVCAMSGFTAYAVVNSMHQARQSRALRVEYCREIEKLKSQNRADVKYAEKHYRQNIKLLGLKDSRALRKAAHASWARTLRRNAPKSCPYSGV